MTASEKRARKPAAKRPYGKCPRCGYTFRLLADGTVCRHRLYLGGLSRWCDVPVDTLAAYREFMEAKP